MKKGAVPVLVTSKVDIIMVPLGEEVLIKFYHPNVRIASHDFVWEILRKVKDFLRAELEQVYIESHTDNEIILKVCVDAVEYDEGPIGKLYVHDYVPFTYTLTEQHFSATVDLPRINGEYLSGTYDLIMEQVKDAIAHTEKAFIDDVSFSKTMTKDFHKIQVRGLCVR